MRFLFVWPTMLDQCRSVSQTSRRSSEKATCLRTRAVTSIGQGHRPISRAFGHGVDKSRSLRGMPIDRQTNG